jgi:hypothetical protein
MARSTKARSCEGKVRYEKRGIAVQALFAVAAKTGANVRRLVAYRCQHCGGFHYGHRQKTPGRSHG